MTKEITFTITDDLGLNASYTQTINITAVNDAPDTLTGLGYNSERRHSNSDTIIILRPRFEWAHRRH